MTPAEFQAAGEAIAARGIFVGCPVDRFESTSRALYERALAVGMTPGSRVCEIGCGCLRSGYWFIRHLVAGGYCGIEPNVPMLQAGRELLMGAELESTKRPRFDYNSTFDLSRFGETFDLVVAFSIWSHAPKRQIVAMLDSFVAHSSSSAKFVASWIPAGDRRSDYRGQEWVGRSAVSNTPGTVAHSIEWIRRTAAARGLGLSVPGVHRTIGQRWLVLSRGAL